MSGIFAGILSWSHFLTEKDIIILMITIWPHWDSLSNAEENENVPVLAPVVQTLDSAIHWINHNPLDNSIGFARVYPLDSDLSGGQRNPPFEQLGPEW